MEQTTWHGFVHTTTCHPVDDGLRITFEDRSSALLPAAQPDFGYWRDLITRQETHGLPVWLLLRENRIERIRFAHVATVLQFTPEPLGGAFLLFSDSPNGQYLPDTHPERERLLEVLTRAFRENLPVLYAVEEEGLIADAEPLSSPETTGERLLSAVEQVSA